MTTQSFLICFKRIQLYLSGKTSQLSRILSKANVIVWGKRFGFGSGSIILWGDRKQCSLWGEKRKCSFYIFFPLQPKRMVRSMNNCVCPRAANPRGSHSLLLSKYKKPWQKNSVWTSHQWSQWEQTMPEGPEVVLASLVFTCFRLLF